MKKTLLFLAFLFAFGASGAQTVDDYVQAHLSIAQQLMREKKVPASIILGVAIHESAAGKSKIARFLNNHFGVKGKNSNTEIRSAYRDYENVEASFHHFTEFLLAKPAYSGLFEKYTVADYKNWARGIQRGGYAASRTWASQVIALIDKYKLYEYDDAPETGTEPVDENKGEQIIIAASEPVKAPVKRVYVVRKNDNLNGISKRLGVSVKNLRSKNALNSIVLQPGQRLKY